MQHPDEGMIHTWLDGELSAEDAAALEAHVADCVQCSAALAEARGLIAGSSRIVSALDSVPGGVIPAARPTRRAWYLTTQFRAAAALLLVAGTSLIVIRKNAQEANKAMFVVAAPRVIATDAISPAAAARATSRNAAVAKPTAPSAASTGSSNSTMAAAAASPAPATAEKRLEAPPPAINRPLPSLSAAPQMVLKSALERPAVQDSAAAGTVADAAVVGGNALRLIRTDSMRAKTQRVFETPNGVQLILTESNQLAFSPSVAQSTPQRESSLSAKSSAARAAPMLPASPQKDQVKFSDYRTITWVDAGTGRSYSLTGPFPPDQLEKFKLVLMKAIQ